MNPEVGVKWAGAPVPKPKEGSAGKRWLYRSLNSARNAARAVREKNRQARLKAGEHEGLRFVNNGEKVISAEDLLEKSRTNSLFYSGM